MKKSRGDGQWLGCRFDACKTGDSLGAATYMHGAWVDGDNLERDHSQEDGDGLERRHVREDGDDIGPMTHLW